MTAGPVARRLYLAGPDVFRPDAQAIAARKKVLCLQHGFFGLDPLDSDLPSGTGPATAMAIYRANVALMRSADAIVANLTPFRGPSADPGTVFELGFMQALGRPAFGYSASAVPFAARTAALCGGLAGADDDGWVIEDLGLHDNLMIDCTLQMSGAPMIVPASGDDPFSGFTRALEAARRHFGTATLESAAWRAIDLEAGGVQT